MSDCMQQDLYEVRIRWGSSSTREEVYEEEGTPPSIYSFYTEAELAAFLDGVEEAIGWLDYEIVDDYEENDDEGGTADP